MKKIISMILIFVLLVSSVSYMGIEADAATTTHIGWFGQNPTVTCAWKFMSGTYGDFQVMEHEVGTVGSYETFFHTSTSDCSKAAIGSVFQMATPDDWAVTAFTAPEDCTVTGDSQHALNLQWMPEKGSFSASADVMVVQMNAEGGFYPVYPTTGSWKWQTITTTEGSAGTTMEFSIQCKKGDVLYYVVKPTATAADTLIKIKICPRVTYTGAVITDYPTGFGGWEAYAYLYDEGPAWYIKSGSTNPHPGSRWTYYYGKDGDFSKMEYQGGSPDNYTWYPSSTAWECVKAWQMVSSHNNWVALGYTVTQTGVATSVHPAPEQEPGKDTVQKAIHSNGTATDFMVVLQNGQTGRYYPVYPTAGTWAWKHMTGTEEKPDIQAGEEILDVPVKKGDRILYVSKPSEGNTGAGQLNIVPKITVTDNIALTGYPERTKLSDWEAVNKETDMGYAASNAYNPAQNQGGEVSSIYTLEYYDTVTNSFKKMETHVTDAGSFWQDATAKAMMKGWQICATNEKCAVAAIHATQSGSIVLTEDTTLTTSASDGEFMLLQRKGEEYHILLDWIRVPQDTRVKVPDIKTHVEAGETVYYLYRSATAVMTVFDINSLPKALYGMGAKNTVSLYPTEWTTIAHVFGELGADLAGMTLSLEGQIAANCYVSHSHKLSSDAYVEFAFPQDAPQKIMISDAISGEYGLKFTCYVPAKAMRDAITVSIYDYGNVIDRQNFSIRQYADAVIAQEQGSLEYMTATSLVKAMLTYGAYSQKLFNYNTDALANAGYEADDKVSTVTSSVLSRYAIHPEKVDGLGTLAGANLILESETSLQLFFRIESGVTPTFELNGQKLAAKMTDGYYVVQIANIKAKDLDKDYVVTVSGNGKSFVATSSVLSYCYAALINQENMELKNLAKALYLYNLEAKAYFGEYIDSSRLTVDRSLFYGICNLAFQDEIWRNGDASVGIEAMAGLGAKSTRLWMCTPNIMEKPCKMGWRAPTMHQIIAETQAKDIQIVGMENCWFNSKTGTAEQDANAVPERDLTADSEYMNFLTDYELMWYTLAKEFSEITVWEIGNEWNQDLFLHPFDYNNGAHKFSEQEKADITTDMLYYASKGIHKANPRALTVLGGLIEVYETGYNNIKTFLEKIYANIESGNWPSTDPDAYFQIAAWHPYNHTGRMNDTWVNRQKEIYRVITEHEGHDKVVLFTEMGFSSWYKNNAEVSWPSNRGESVTQTLQMTYEKLPFVQSVFWFRLFNADYELEANGDYFEAYFGLLTEVEYTYNGSATTENIIGSQYYIKDMGEAFKNAAGGTGIFERKPNPGNGEK